MELSQARYNCKRGAGVTQEDGEGMAENME
jgi:hypothetical protein